jgi:hypothetical protein
MLRCFDSLIIISSLFVSPQVSLLMGVSSPCHMPQGTKPLWGSPPLAIGLVVVSSCFVPTVPITLGLGLALLPSPRDWRQQYASSGIFMVWWRAAVMAAAWTWSISIDCQQPLPGQHVHRHEWALCHEVRV